MTGTQGPAAVHLDPVLEEFARTVVTQQLGSGTTRVEALQVGVHHAVLLLTVGPSSRRVVLKVAGPGNRRGIDYERTATVTDLARATGTRVPGVLAVDTSYLVGPWRYLLLEHLDGVEWRHVRPLLDDDELRRAHQQIAEALLTIQSVQVNSFGQFTNRGPLRQDLLSALRCRADLLIMDEGVRGSFDELLDRRASLFVVPEQTPTLTHDDLHHANLLFRAARDGWQLTGVLDWDKAWAGPAESDVARMAFWDDMTGPGFWEVYRSAVPIIDGHLERMRIYQLLWCLEYNSDSARHVTDTKTLLRQLGVE